MTKRERHLRELKEQLREHKQNLADLPRKPPRVALSDFPEDDVCEERPGKGEESSLGKICTRCGWLSNGSESRSCRHGGIHVFEPSTTEGEREKALQELSRIADGWCSSCGRASQIAELLPLLAQRQEQGERIGPRAEIQRFSEWMELRLRENDYKQYWTSLSAFELLPKLRGEVGELEDATNPHRPQGSCHEEVTREAADVANYAMMIADIHGTKARPDHPEPAGGR